MRSQATKIESGAPRDESATSPLVFFHVMKCGGTSVRTGLAGTVSDNNRSGLFELDGEAAKAAAAGKDKDNWVFRDALLSYILRTTRPSVVLGHFRYRDRYEELLDRAHFVTVLREPVERIESLYKYRRYKDTVDVPVSFGFEDFLASKRWSKEGHAYVSTFCGRDDIDPRSDEAIAVAAANLRRFAVIGFTDRLEDFARRVTPLLPSSVMFPLMNTSPAPAAAADSAIDAVTIERARSVCAPDLRLFQEVRSWM